MVECDASDGERSKEEAFVAREEGKTSGAPAECRHGRFAGFGRRQTPAPKKDQLRFYGALVDTLKVTVAPKDLVGKLSGVVEELKQLAKGLQSGLST